jgi:hypothetical protein
MKNIIAFTALIACMCTAYATALPTVAQGTGVIRTMEKVKPAISVGAPYGRLYPWYFNNASDLPMTNVHVSIWNSDSPDSRHELYAHLLPAHTRTPQADGLYYSGTDWWHITYTSNGRLFDINKRCSVFNEDVDSGGSVVVEMGNYSDGAAHGHIWMPKSSSCQVTISG